MKKLLIVMASVCGIFVCLFAQNVNDYDKGYIASIKNNKCMKVTDYPGKDVKPSTLLKDPGCGIITQDDTIKTLIIVCTDSKTKKSIMYSYAMTLDTCKESLEVAKKRGY